jgi:hypothetical protein
MNNILDKYSNETRNYVAEYLVSKYYFDKITAENIVKNSSFNLLLNDNPEYVMHFNIEYWAEKTKKENDILSNYNLN